MVIINEATLQHIDSGREASTVVDEEQQLTTVDNPYSPFTEWDDWYSFDESNGYHSLSLLARIAIVTDEMSDTDRELAIDEAIDDIVRENFSGMHKKAYRTDYAKQ